MELSTGDVAQNQHTERTAGLAGGAVVLSKMGPKTVGQELPGRMQTRGLSTTSKRPWLQSRVEKELVTNGNEQHILVGLRRVPVLPISTGDGWAESSEHRTPLMGLKSFDNHWLVLG